MAKKQPPKPLFELRHEFVASLENVCNQSIFLLQVVSTILQQPDSGLKPGIKAMLQERHDAMRDALMSKDD